MQHHFLTRTKEHEDIKNSQHLGVSLSDDRIAYFNKGILCTHLLEVPEHNFLLEQYPLNIQKTEAELPDIDFSWPSGLYFGDGPGGIFNNEAIRRCGVGVTHVSNNIPHKPCII